MSISYFSANTVKIIAYKYTLYAITLNYVVIHYIIFYQPEVITIIKKSQGLTKPLKTAQRYTKPL